MACSSFGLICGTGTATGSLIVEIQARGPQRRGARQAVELERQRVRDRPRPRSEAADAKAAVAVIALRSGRDHLARQIEMGSALLDDDQLAGSRDRFEHGPRVER